MWISSEALRGAFAMYRRPNRRRRRALTLVELLVVIALITVVATLGYFALGSFAGPSNVANGVDRLSGWLLIAKQRAKRDGVPTGIRISTDPSGQIYSVVQYIQQPDAFASGRCTAVNTSLATFTYNFGSTGLPDVLPGDYLELNGGPLHQIATVSGTQLTVATATLPANQTYMNLKGSLPNYRIIRQPRLIDGEEPMNLPGTVGVDPTKSTPPSSTISPGSYDILFAPSGAVIGQGTPSGQIYLWVRDMTANTATDIKAGYGTIIAIQVRSGTISSQPVGPASDPYQFTRDARGGM
jgi:prepilin-type N-terminal cleavage/methylation domain-containing protein